MRVLVGTSGYSYKEWKGRFYPEKMKAAEMLGFYARRFPTVEINNTFYRMPTKDLVARWAAEVPAGFTFVLKAPRRITHERKLMEVDDSLAYFFETASTLGPALGPTLVQLPPYFRRDLERLRSFLASVPEGRRVALEFRHESWSDEAVTEALRARGAALCLADVEDGAPQEITATARWGYLRLRRPDYTDEDLASWAARIRAQPWDEAFVFFKHEDEARGPEMAARLVSLLSA
jgi:uncharacterized protein YecE (DUF72 family)